MQNMRSGELSSSLYKTYKNAVKPHGCHIRCTSADMDMEKCVLVSNNIMGYYTGTVYYHVVINAKV